jgi:hypothetical protein
MRTLPKSNQIRRPTKQEQSTPYRQITINKNTGIKNTRSDTTTHIKYFTHREGEERKKTVESPIDQHPSTCYGNSVQMKSLDSIQIFFQNVKGLTHTSGLKDYYYYVQSMTTHHIDIAGLAETNTAWQHPHLQADFRK